MNYILDMLKFSAEQDIQVGSSHKPVEMQDMNSERRQGWLEIRFGVHPKRSDNYITESRATESTAVEQIEEEGHHNYGHKPI